MLEPAHDQQPVYFHSRTISGLTAPYLCFPEASDLDHDAFMALVDEQSGATTWLEPDAVHNNRQSILVKVPARPFHVEAVTAAGSDHRLTFAYPREVGQLSAWVGPLLNSATLLLSAGSMLWLGTVFWRPLGLHALRRAAGERTGMASTAPILQLQPEQPDSARR